MAALLGVCVPFSNSVCDKIPDCIQVLISPEGQKRHGSTNSGGGEVESLQRHVVQFLYVFRGLKTLLGNQNYMTDSTAKCLLLSEM